MNNTLADNHVAYMQLALEEAKKAGQIDEVPIGAVIVSNDGKVLALAHNQVILRSDPTAHAELIAIREACRALGNYRLLKASIYVTVEPCPMCMGAIVHARLARLVFGTSDPKWGAAGSLYDFSKDSRLNHQVEIISGISMASCKQLMQEFFRARRGK